MGAESPPPTISTELVQQINVSSPARLILNIIHALPAAVIAGARCV